MKPIMGIRRRTWAEICMNAIDANFNVVKQAVAPSVKVCCVIKADGYGHGAVTLAKRYEELSADYFAVSNIEEALELRRAGITRPILILGFTPSECADLLARENLSQCVYSYEYGRALAERAEQSGAQVKIHIKLDTGMGRIGFRGEREWKQAEEICYLPSLLPEGIFTHFAVADESEDGDVYTERQARLFAEGVAYLEGKGIRFDVRHCANSAAIFDHPECHFDMVRAGIVLYGFAPSGKMRNLPELKPVMTLKTVISHIKTLKKGETVSYGRTYTANQPVRIATVPIGYADGFSRRLGNGRYSLKIGDRYAPIVGRVCMDQLMLDVTELPCSVGDTVTVFGDDSKASADEMARINETINYEISCDVAKRVPRIYLCDGDVVGIMDSLVSNEIE
ncbi:MAG: alanine racemase [Clostridia bacterium]|nr:alanine racemase [Clostridia bacterium]